jgi:hypothetical protein
MRERVVVWLPNRDAGWEMPAAEPYRNPLIEGGRRSMHELAAAIAATGRQVEFRGEMSRALVEELNDVAGVSVELPDRPRHPVATDTVVVNEGVTDPRVYARLALSPARTILLALGPLGMSGWPFTEEPWAKPDFLTVATDTFARPEGYAAASALGFELWTNSDAIEEATMIGTGRPTEFPPPPGVKDIDVLTLAENRWAPLARQVVMQLNGARTHSLPTTTHASALEHFGRARILVHPMRVEGSSRIGCEARAMGAVPVVLASNRYGVGMDEAHGAVPVRSIDEMPAVVRELLASPERLSALSAAGVESARRQVDWDAYVKRIDTALARPRVADPGRAARAGMGAALHEEDRLRSEREDELHAELDEHRAWLASTNSSLSWRLTGPLRAAKQWLWRR